ncbi:MAG TPA: VOC family protein [Cellulomonas sp.]
MDTGDTPRHGVTGEHITDGRPHGCTTLTPFLALPRAAEAIEFYREVLGARVADVTRIDGAVVHADLDLGTGHLQLGEPHPAYHLLPPPTGADGDGACYSLGFSCADVDAVQARAVAAGAVVRDPAQTFVSGDRYASVRDPFGVRWSLMSRVEDLSEQASARRVAAWAAEQGSSADV